MGSQVSSETVLNKQQVRPGQVKPTGAVGEIFGRIVLDINTISGRIGRI